jgi:hypothetical protein
MFYVIEGGTLLVSEYSSCHLCNNSSRYFDIVEYLQLDLVLQSIGEVEEVYG